MGSQFKAIVMRDTVESILDELNMIAETKLEHAKSETTKTVLELGYKSCLNDLYNKINALTTIFVDRDNIHEAVNDIIPYESDELTELSVHKEQYDYSPLTYADQIPSTVYINEMEYVKK